MLGDAIPLLSPLALRTTLPLSSADVAFIAESREAIQAILTGKDQRFLVIVGPCSIHETQEALLYAERLKALADGLKDKAFIVLRAYFQKSRTAGGWQGLLVDPRLDGSHDIALGLEKARTLALRLTTLRMPLGMELVDPAGLHYLADCLSWGAIGARTVESSLHRQLASGAPFPIGFKNNMAGSIQAAIQAVGVASKPQTYMDINAHGALCLRTTPGNPWGHIILRGGVQRPNYAENDLQEAIQGLTKNGLPLRILIDCAHGNSTKHGACQSTVFEAALKLREAYPAIRGLMLESYLKAGKQNFPADPQPILSGLSLTDPCLGWEETEALLRKV